MFIMDPIRCACRTRQTIDLRSKQENSLSYVRFHSMHPFRAYMFANVLPAFIHYYNLPFNVSTFNDYRPFFSQKHKEPTVRAIHKQCTHNCTICIE